jgi:hypothetical protein
MSKTATVEVKNPVSTEAPAQSVELQVMPPVKDVPQGSLFDLDVFRDHKDTRVAMVIGSKTVLSKGRDVGFSFYMKPKREMAESLELKGKEHAMELAKVVRGVRTLAFDKVFAYFSTLKDQGLQRFTERTMADGSKQYTLVSRTMKGTEREEFIKYCVAMGKDKAEVEAFLDSQNPMASAETTVTK